MTASNKILLVEDEVNVVSFIKKGLSEEGFLVDVAMNGEQGQKMALQYRYDLIILDIMLPGINGLDICREIRKQQITTPILFLTALGTAENIVIGLDRGADDYLVKPFKFIELLARIKAILRRRNTNLQAQQQREESKYTIGDLELDDYTKTVKRGQEFVTLTTTEYKLLLLFLKNQRRVLSRTEILEAVWDVNFNIGTNVVDVYVNYLRKKVDKSHDNKLIHTVVGMGYVLKEVYEKSS
ncbi:response regulator transcription factor [Pollutibacter soli]|uniref:response regulator transcription factor n=1 Tax=Pollutibacter soli TaxID=3034157 RepID=UPI0030140BB8